MWSARCWARMSETVVEFCMLTSMLDSSSTLLCRRWQQQRIQSQRILSDTTKANNQYQTNICKPNDNTNKAQEPYLWRLVSKARTMLLPQSVTIVTGSHQSSPKRAISARTCSLTTASHIHKTLNHWLKITSTNTNTLTITMMHLPSAVALSSVTGMAPKC